MRIEPSFIWNNNEYFRYSEVAKIMKFWRIKTRTIRLYYRMNAFEIWLWRPVVCVRCNDTRTDEWIRRRVLMFEAGHLHAIKCRKKRKYEPRRRRPESLLCRTFDGRICGKNRPEKNTVDRHYSATTIAVERLRPWEYGIESIIITPGPAL